ncbi:MAG TPA: hypothetical protein VKU92_09070 [Acidimicrobiales bacterium]|nr:hypothetical protein [Acidimicrobiales bacterium]
MSSTPPRSEKPLSGKAPRRTKGPAAGGGRATVAEAGLEGAHEWVSFEDPDEERTWLVDVTFLESTWECIFARGCQGVLTGPAAELSQGCCSYGAHFTSEADATRVAAAATTLTASQWQFRQKGRSVRGVVRTSKAGELKTRLVDGACIFLNRPGFEGGAGCALHRAALERGVEPLELKPDVCWQLPLRRADETAPDGHVVSTLGEWGRRHWGKGGHDFHWWCTEAPEAFGGRRPVYQALRAEITAMTGERVYALICAYLDGRRRRPVRLPHPAVRPSSGRAPAAGPAT